MDGSTCILQHSYLNSNIHFIKMKTAVIIALALCIQDGLCFSHAGIKAKSLIDPVLPVVDDIVEKVLALLQDQLPSYPSVPVGFLYTQYPYQSEPSDIFLNTTWEDVTPLYEGHFFRAAGGSAESFGMSQSEHSPSLLRAESMKIKATPETEKHSVDVPMEGNSEWLWTGDDLPGWGAMIGTRFQTDGGEVRPANYAIRIWKRVE